MVASQTDYGTGKYYHEPALVNVKKWIKKDESGHSAKVPLSESGK
jgi:hypothetical protein